MDVTELLAALPPREIANMLVYRCLDSQEPSLSMNLDANLMWVQCLTIPNSNYPCSDVQERGKRSEIHISE